MFRLSFSSAYLLAAPTKSVCSMGSSARLRNQNACVRFMLAYILHGYPMARGWILKIEMKLSNGRRSVLCAIDAWGCSDR